MKRTITLTLAIALAAISVSPASAGGPSVSAQEQQLLYDLNQIRHDPSGYGTVRDLKTDMQAVMPRPALAINTSLASSTDFKSTEMYQSGYIAHQSETTGMWPNALAVQHGYSLAPEFPMDANNIESIHVGSNDITNVLESFMKSPSHRHHLTGGGWFSTHTEAGVGKTDDAAYWTIHTAYSDPDQLFVTGVAYADDNDNGRMDLGEALGDVVIAVGGHTTVTNEGGGYAVPVEPGFHNVSARGPSFGEVISTRVFVGKFNVEADFTPGRDVYVYDYQLCIGHEPTIIGSSLDEVIVGTPGDDVIHGLGGDDEIRGLGGNDIICGGLGDDVIYGGPGGDKLVGGGGADILIGSAGADALRGGPGRDRLSGGLNNDILFGGVGPDTVIGGEGRDRCVDSFRAINCERLF